MKTLSSKIYNLTTIIEDYCKNHQEDSEEIANIYPVIEYLYKNVGEMHYETMGYEDFFEM